MVFHVTWNFLTTSLRIPPESRSDEGGIRRRVDLAWKTIQNAFSRILYNLIKLNIMCKVADHENHVRWIYLTTVLCMGEGQKYASICYVVMLCYMLSRGMDPSFSQVFLVKIYDMRMNMKRGGSSIILTHVIFLRQDWIKFHLVQVRHNDCVSLRGQLIPGDVQDGAIQTATSCRMGEHDANILLASAFHNSASMLCYVMLCYVMLCYPKVRSTN